MSRASLTITAMVGLLLATTTGFAQPRTLILALDGVPLRSVHAAREQGGFQGWSPPVGMISTFPSMTNVAFTAILRPFCVHPIAGYEPKYYDPTENSLVSGASKKHIQKYFPWRSRFQVTKRSFGDKVALYTRPMSLARRMMRQVEDLVLDTSEDPILAHLASTDLVTHVRGDEPIIEFLLELDQQLQRLGKAQEEEFGRPLRIIMLSDHGNTENKVTTTSDLRQSLRAAGFRFRKHLEEPKDIAGPTYGVVSYGAIHLDPAGAESAARAAVGSRGVDLAAWVRQPGEIRVVSIDQEAAIRWREVSDGWQFSYDSITGDPLKLEEARSKLVVSGTAGPDGFAAEADWFAATADGYYPDPLRRLVESLVGTWVENPATVMLSLHPDWAWGAGNARTGAYLLGGRLEGTHGALERESTLGFLMANEPLQGDERNVGAQETLLQWFEQRDCISMMRVE